MASPSLFRTQIKRPAMASTLYLLSGPDLVIACADSGFPAAVPSLNNRTTDGFKDWLLRIQSELSEAKNTASGPIAPFGVNLIVHPTNKRLEADLEAIVAAKVPYVITSLGAAKDVVSAIHSYGGIVLHDVINKRHGEKALAANVDGLIAVSSGAGGHAGTIHPFALLHELKPLMGDKMLVLSGSISSGGDIAAAISAGADMAYMGTRFIAAAESQAVSEYKDMVLQSGASDIIYTNKISGVYANFMSESLKRAGIDIKSMEKPKMDMNDEAKVWSDIWSAGHGVSAIHEILPTSELIQKLKIEFSQAQEKLSEWR